MVLNVLSDVNVSMSHFSVASRKGESLSRIGVSPVTVTWMFGSSASRSGQEVRAEGGLEAEQK